MKKIVTLLINFFFINFESEAQNPIHPPPVPNGYEIKKSHYGVTLYKKDYENTYVQLVELDKGASVKFLIAEKTTTEGDYLSNPNNECFNSVGGCGNTYRDRTGHIHDGFYGATDPAFKRIDIYDFWKDLEKKHTNPFSIISGAYWSCADCYFGCEVNGSIFGEHAFLSFPLKIDDNVISGGHDPLPDAPLMILQIGDKVSLSTFYDCNMGITHKITEPQIYKNAIVGYNKSKSAGGTRSDARNYIGIKGNNKIIILTSDAIKHSDANYILTHDFPTDDYMILDGGGSVKLAGLNESKIYYEYLHGNCGLPQPCQWRDIPQSIGILHGRDSEIELTAPIILASNNINQCSIVSFSATVKNLLSIKWFGKIFISLHKMNDDFIQDLIVSQNITIHPGDDFTLSVGVPLNTIQKITAGNIYKIYVKYQTNGTPYPNEYPFVGDGGFLNPTFMPVNYSANCNECTIPPGNYKKIEMYGLNINQSTNELEFMYHAFPAKQGDPIVDIEVECARLKKIFKTAIVTRSSNQWITIDPLPLYYTQSWGNVVLPRAPLPFRNSEMANRMFIADLYLKQFWDAQFRVDAMNYWKVLVLQSPYWNSIHLKGFNNYAFYPCRAAIIPGLVVVNSTNSSIQINSALLSVESENFHTPYILPWYGNLSLLTQQEKNDLNNRLKIFDKWVDTELINRENAVSSLLNNHVVFDNIRQIYSTIALAKKYKQWNHPNKPMANLFDSENMKGISDPMIPDQVIVDMWNKSSTSVPEFNQTVPFSDFNGGLGHLSYGGCVMSGINPIDSGSLNATQQILDTAVFQNKNWIANDTTFYFYGGSLDLSVSELTPVLFHPNKPQIVLGDSIQISTNIYNFGGAKAQNFEVHLYEQYKNAQNQLQNILIGQKTISLLDTFSSQNIIFTWIPKNYGSKKLVLTVDEGNAVTEKKENNNIALDSVDVLNNVPFLEILSPVDGSAMGNENISLSGSASDYRDGYLQYTNLKWSSNIDGFLGNGSFLTVDSLSVGSHIITFTGTNSHGQTSFNYINIYVYPQGYPFVTISSPVGKDTFADNAPILFSGSGMDLTDGDLCNSTVWSSNLKSNFGTGCNLNAILPVGAQSISFTAKNTAGHTSNASANIIVVSGTPNLIITNPVSNTSYYQQQNILLSATAFDYPQGNISSGIQWYSDLQGYLGAGQSFSVQLIPGVHNITGVVQDNNGSIDSASVYSIHIKFTPPVPVIVQPTSNSTFLYNNIVTLIGLANDLQDGALHDNRLQWYSNLQGFLGIGDTITTTSLNYGYHIISLKAIDSNNTDSTVAVANIFIDAGLPICSISQPANGASFFFGNAIAFKGSANDPQNGILSGNNLQWSSNIDGDFAPGDSITINSLSAGNHTITLTATDHDGFAGSKTKTINVQPPHAPVVSIYYPASNTRFIHGTTVTLKAIALDYEEGSLPNHRISWSSNIDGNLGIGKIISTSTFSVGVHNITATAFDTLGSTTVYLISIIIDQQKPVSQIISPISGSVFSQGTTITFTGSSTDYEDGTLSGNSLQWSSNVNGNIGIGNSINSSLLSVGSHFIYLIGTDAQNAKDTTKIAVIIQAPNTAIQKTFINGEDSISHLFVANGGDAIVNVSLPETAIVLNAQATILGLSDLIASVTISAYPNGPYKCGELITFVAMPVNGGNSPRFQWKINGMNVGNDAAVLMSNTIQNGDQVSVVMTSNLNDVSEMSVISNLLIINCKP